MNELELLGKPPSDDSIGEINSLIHRLVGDIEVGIEQRGRGDGKLLYLIEDGAIAMKKKLRETCPDFRAWREGTKFPTKQKSSNEPEYSEEPSSFTPVPDVLLEGGDPPADKGTREVIYLDSIIKKKIRWVWKFLFFLPLLTPTFQVRLPVDSRMVGKVRWRRNTLGPSQRNGPSQQTTSSREPQVPLELLSRRQSKYNVNTSHVVVDYTRTYCAAIPPSSLGMVMLTFFQGCD